MPTENMNLAKKSIIRKKNVNIVYIKNGQLIAHVSKKLPLSELKSEDIVPRNVNGIRTDVVESGEVNYKNSKKYRPIFGGISCAESNSGAATLGAIVRDPTTRNLVGLTCNHCAGTLYDVTYDWPAYGNTALSHIEMLQPSWNDGGTLSDSIGNPVRAVATQFGALGNNRVDAAIIEIPFNLQKSDIQNISQGPFLFSVSKGDYAPGTVVYKNGRTTDLTEGTVYATAVDVSVTDGADEVYYEDQIMLDLEAISGDSGSVIVTKELGIWRIIGLFFAANATHSFANHILDVADELGIEAWDGSVTVDGEFDFIMVNGKCYKYKGTTLYQLSHTKQKDFDTCAACKGEAYPHSKTQVMN